MATNIKNNWLNLTVADLNIMNNTFICLECVQGNSVYGSWVLIHIHVIKHKLACFHVSDSLFFLQYFTLKLLLQK